MADPLRHMTLAEAKTRLLELSNIPFRKLIDRIPEDAVRAKAGLDPSWRTELV